MECHKLDNDKQVFFYEQDFYVLSKFSAFTLQWKGRRFYTSEAAYHWEKFPDRADIQFDIESADSAHEAFKVGERNRQHRRQDWDSVKISIMHEILRAKAQQHEYVRRKLLATGDRKLIEDSWRDDFWGWGPNRDGTNMLGRLWMEVRAELRGLPHNVGAQRRLTATERSGSEATELSSIRLQRPCYVFLCIGSSPNAIDNLFIQFIKDTIRVRSTASVSL